MSDWVNVAEQPGLSVRLMRSQSGRMVVAGVRLEADPVTAEMLRQIPIAAIEKAANTDDLPNLPPLVRTDGQTAREFSALVAQHYAAWARVDPHPGAAIAAKWNVNSATVHTWIREARLRGFLPEVKRGKH